MKPGRQIVSAALLCLMISPAGGQTASDAELFDKHCALCHREGGTGTYGLERRLGQEQSMLEQRERLSKEYITTAVRWGIGSMPRFSRAEITDDELSTIIEYLVDPAEQEGAYRE